jgi:hypothetical protein
MIAHDYALSPPKPCLDAEPRYEDHPVGTPKWDPDAEPVYFNDFDVRKAAYWAFIRRRVRPHLRLPRHLADVGAQRQVSTARVRRGMKRSTFPARCR